MSPSHKKVTVPTSYGHRITVLEDDYIGQRIIKKGIYEGILLQFVTGILNKMSHPVVLDIGANIGNHSLVFSKFSAKVVSFEPLPDIFAILSVNVDQNSIDNVACINSALSNEEGSATIYRLAGGNVGASSLDKRSENSEPFNVTLQLGDNAVRELHLPSVDLIKIDVEGHELSALQGLQSTIKQYRPYIVMEWEDPLSIERLVSANILEELFHDYTVYVLGSNYDNGYWHKKTAGKLFRKLTRLFLPQKAKLYTFDITQAYKNILLVPRGKESYLPL